MITAPVFSRCCQGGRAVNRRDIPAALSDTRFLSSCQGMRAMKIAASLAHHPPVGCFPANRRAMSVFFFFLGAKSP